MFSGKANPPIPSSAQKTNGLGLRILVSESHSEFPNASVDTKKTHVSRGPVCGVRMCRQVPYLVGCNAWWSSGQPNGLRLCDGGHLKKHQINSCTNAR
jgi:hypothetical protein